MNSNAKFIKDHIDIDIQVADDKHLIFAKYICDAMKESAKARGTGIAERSIDYLERKISSQMAFIAMDLKLNTWAGFCYIETWDHGKYVANSGLIVLPHYRGLSLATRIKEKAFNYTRQKFPNAKLFGLTTNPGVMSINSDLGYRPTNFSALTGDKLFWDGCKTCVNHNILVSKNFKDCLCTGMLFDPHRKKSRLENEILKSKNQNNENTSLEGASHG